ncbi:hypothetical protein B0H13DRAFT_1850720 [Mycena leptocephala]|nr:hypothetical protein B0H13DRAFT_1850720 [Mycena leptocephala]
MEDHRRGPARTYIAGSVFPTPSLLFGTCLDVSSRAARGQDMDRYNEREWAASPAPRLAPPPLLPLHLNPPGSHHDLVPRIADYCPGPAQTSYIAGSMLKLERWSLQGQSTTPSITEDPRSELLACLSEAVIEPIGKDIGIRHLHDRASQPHARSGVALNGKRNSKVPQACNPCRQGGPHAANALSEVVQTSVNTIPIYGAVARGKKKCKAKKEEKKKTALLTPP